MIGRFVKSQEIVGVQNQLCHCKARPFAAAQHCHFLVYVLPFEEKGGKYIPELCPDVPYCYPVKCPEDGIILVQDILLVLCIIPYVDIVACPRLS